MLVDVFRSVMIQFTLVLLCSCNAVNFSTDLFPPSGKISVIVTIDSILGTVFQVMALPLFEDTQINSTVWPTLTFWYSVASIKVSPEV